MPTIPEGARGPRYDGTLDSLVAVILADIINSALNGQSRKYPLPSEVENAGDRFLDTPMANGKTLSECTVAEWQMLSEAYIKIGKMRLGNEGK
jgi:hypothetical protein